MSARRSYAWARAESDHWVEITEVEAESASSSSRPCSWESGGSFGFWPGLAGVLSSVASLDWSASAVSIQREAYV